MSDGRAHDGDNLIGLRVQVRKNGHLIRTGYVEDVSQAVEALWLEAHGVEARALFEKAEGYSAEPIKEVAQCNL